MGMSGRTTRTLIAEAFGEDIEYQTAGNYDIAGVVVTPAVDEGFPPRIVAVGTSWASVTKRTRRANSRLRPDMPRGYEHMVLQVVNLVEQTAPQVRAYFGTHQVAVSGYFKPGEGWTDGLNHTAGRSYLRQLAREGVTGVSFYRRGRNADFQMTELLKSMNTRKAAR